MRTLLLSFAAVMASMTVNAEEYKLTSPDKKLTVTVETEQVLTWAIEHDGTTVMMPSGIWMETDAGDMGLGMTVKKDEKREVRGEGFNELTLKCGDYSVVFRAYNDCAAYRFETKKKDFKVQKENAFFNFEADCKAFVPYVNDNRGGERWCYSFESYYDEAPLSKMYDDSLAITPLAVCLPDGKKAVIMDAGVEDYPGMYLVKDKGNSNAIKADFPPYPTATTIGGFNRLNIMPTQRAEYIATCDKAREFPWRAVVVTTNDGQLLNCDVAKRLAPESRIKDTSWIRPGKVAWDWWNNLNITGVDFEAGINTDTYKDYIDFAKNNHLEYIIIDEGWSSPESLMELSGKMDLPALVEYAKERGVRIILWSSWRNMIGRNDNANVNDNMMDEVMDHYAKMGIAGFKVDFFDRDDQEAIRSAYEVAECAAKHHLVLDLHGLKPFGIQYAYPNILNFEGVKGLENSKWEPRVGDGPLHDQPRYDVTAPYLRMLSGPMDYTPGAMSNATRDQFFGNNDHPMSQGTRVHQMAMYTIFNAPLQMLADSPTKYEKEQECTDFIREIPTVFDETTVLGGEMGEYIAMARRKGDTWYVAAMTNWQARDITIDLSKLFSPLTSNSSSLSIDIFADGRNAHREATDYKHTKTVVSPTDKLNIHLAPGGGWTAVVRVEK